MMATDEEIRKIIVSTQRYGLGVHQTAPDYHN